MENKKFTPWEKYHEMQSVHEVLKKMRNENDTVKSNAMMCASLIEAINRALSKNKEVKEYHILLQMFILGMNFGDVDKSLDTFSFVNKTSKFAEYLNISIDDEHLDKLSSYLTFLESKLLLPDLDGLLSKSSLNEDQKKSLTSMLKSLAG